jgi:hypothetical protein
MGSLPLGTNADPTADCSVTTNFSMDFTSPSTVTTVVPTAAAGSFNPLTGLGIYRTLLFLCNVQGATGGTLDIYFQVSADAGTTWHDFCHLPQIAAGAALAGYTFAVSDFQAASTISAVGTGSTPTLAANTLVTGPFGERMRIIVKSGAGTSAGAAQQIRIAAGS